MIMFLPGGKSILVVGHPGHELRVFNWLEIHRPAVFVITDGSGGSGHSRLSSTTRILDQVGASPGSFYGPVTDRQAYAAILNHDFEFFIRLTQKLARFLIDENVSCVVGDALEGYNPTHDACRLVIGAAVEMVLQTTGRVVLNYDFSLAGAPDSVPQSPHFKLELDDDAFARKMSVAQSYAELESEVNDAIKEHRFEAFRVEYLRSVPNHPPVFVADYKPYYEQFGEQRVSSGAYSQVIRYSEHVLPLAAALWTQVAAVLPANS